MGHMNTALTHSISSASSAETEKIGEQIGRQLRGGEIIELLSDLGGGKTTLVRGIAKGFGSKDKVSSPTFTVNKEYVSGDKRIVHYDFYRLHAAGLLEHELAESLADPLAVTIIEWADIVHDVLPAERISIRLTTTGEHERSLHIHVPESKSYVVASLVSTKIVSQP